MNSKDSQPRPADTPPDATSSEPSEAVDSTSPLAAPSPAAAEGKPRDPHRPDPPGEPLAGSTGGPGPHATPGGDDLLNIPDFILNAIRMDDGGLSATVARDDIDVFAPVEERPEKPAARPAPPEPPPPPPPPLSPPPVSTTQAPVDSPIADAESAPGDAIADSADADAIAPSEDSVNGGYEAVLDQPGTSAPNAPPEESADSNAPEDASPGFSVEEGTSVFQFSREIASFCFSRLGSWDLVKDATAETITHLLREESRYRDGGKDRQRERVLDVARCVCLDLLRRNALITGPATASAPTPLPVAGMTTPSLPDTPTGAETTDDPALAGARARALVKEMQEPQRSIVRLRMWNEASFAEIGALLGKSEQSVASLYRATLKSMEKKAGDPSSPLTPALTPAPVAKGASETPDAAVKGRSHDDEALIGADGVELEKAFAAFLVNPSFPPNPPILVAVARRVLAATAVSEATLRFASKDFDILPAFQKVQNLARLKGEPPVERHPGERIFGGEILVVGGEATVVVGLRSGHELVIGPGSVVVLGTLTGAEEGTASVAVLQGRVVCLPGAQVNATLTVSFPGGMAQSLYDAFQVVVLSMASTRLETIDGTPVVSNKNAKRNPGRTEAVMCRGGTNPAISPARKETAFLDWLVPVTKSTGFPPDTRDRFQALMNLASNPTGRAGTSSSTQTASLAKSKGEAEKKRTMMIAAGVALAVIVVAGYFMMRGDGFSRQPVSQDWFAGASSARREELGLPARAPGGPPATFRIFRGGSIPSGVSLSGLRFGGSSPEEMMMMGGEQTLAFPAFEIARAQAWGLAQSTPNWPQTPAELAKRFGDLLKNRDPQGLAMATPGIPVGLWMTILMMMPQGVNVTVEPAAGGASGSVAGVFNLTLAAGTTPAPGDVHYELVVMQTGDAGGRPWIDVLASRWDLTNPAPGSPGAPAGAAPAGPPGGITPPI